MDRAAGLDVVELERLVVRELLARVDQADLVDLDPFFFLELPLDLQHLVGRLEGHGLLAARQRLDEDLRVIIELIGREVGAREAGSCVRAVRDPLSLSARPDALARRALGARLCCCRYNTALAATRALRMAPDSLWTLLWKPACRRKAASASVLSQ